MNCLYCGSAIPEDESYCPLCGRSLDSSQEARPIRAMDYTRFQKPYAPAQAESTESESDEEDTTFQTQYGTYAHRPSRQRGNAGKFTSLYIGTFENTVENTVKQYPQNLWKSIAQPEELLRELMQKKDLITALVNLILLLVLSFFAGMFFARGMTIRLIGTLLSLYTGYAANAYQDGLATLSWGTAAGFGGISVVLMLLSLLILCGVGMLYLVVLKKQAFAPELLFSFFTVIALPLTTVLLLFSLLSLLSPWPAIVLLLAEAGLLLFQLQALLQSLTGNNANDVALIRGVSLLSLLLVCAVLIFLGGSLGANALLSFWTVNLEKMLTFKR